MYCLKCKNEVSSNTGYCPVCGEKLTNMSNQRYNLPNNMNYNYMNYYQQPHESAGFGIASMVLGILALCFSCCIYYISLPCAIIGFILGAVGLKRQAGRGMAIAGLVCSLVSFIPVIIIISTGASIISSLMSY